VYKTVDKFKSLIFLLLLTSACSHSQVNKQTLDSRWWQQNSERLTDFIHQHGPNGSLYDSTLNAPRSQKPVAAFDWDNTLIKNDAGDATFFWMLAHDLIKVPVDWAATSRYLSTEAVSELKAKCKADKGSINLSTRFNTGCADLILSIYSSGKISDSKPAWKSDFNPDTLEPGYAWAVALTAGYKPSEIQQIAKVALEFNLANQVGTQQRIGSRDYVAWLRFYEPMKDLIQLLKIEGYDVWIVSASAQNIIEVYAREIGVETSHVIGVRSELKNGKATSSFQSCGTEAAGNQNLITYRQGKRCWINKEIFMISNKNLQMDKPSATVFAAGDSDTDSFFVKDARIHLVINRNKTELMCNAYANQDGKWIINPMFIEPKPQKSGNPAYSCSPFGLPDQPIDYVF
jgi:hypothetical protein